MTDTIHYTYYVNNLYIWQPITTSTSTSNITDPYLQGIDNLWCTIDLVSTNKYLYCISSTMIMVISHTRHHGKIDELYGE